ncbi:MAG: hypothetical protein COX92_01040 [Candidatus Nealsonbacteria bacterium CG_4_10_14_0_2_um_filter_40_15]|uniref:Uncharacterized protein n=2 Tax=Candidatus Nealsoniibacteriota TaxID=1817911 RepID=A0A2M7D7Z8_9BACT|nr:MAG: hypothetical protein COS26_01680 [Candidatus Nealsonbacteria bacterium CG02_land_8_20_14_3_00_40_11]PIZ87532.1 MAG: hypothetical protein COX92_01040 [Candidatus Nealsonbacteria bacterium CG_4_10_14_0_2_um_filter_40_15]
MKKIWRKFKTIWGWFGEEKNHNVLTFIIALIAVILAFPYFSKQINNIQIKIDSIESSLQQLYQHYDREIITCDQIKDGAKTTDDGTLLTIYLKNKAISNSVNVWWGEMYLSPTDYSVTDNILVIHFVPQTPDVIIDSCNLIPIVAVYVENNQ